MRWKATPGVAAAALLLTLPGAALAAGTTAGTDISNTATVDYTVGGLNQPDISSNTVTFETDRRINLTVAEVLGAYTTVTPGQTLRVLTFTVTNSTNAPLDFRLIASDDALGIADPFGGFDDFDPSLVQVFVDADASGTYVAATDIGTFLDEIPADATRTVFIVSTIQAGLTDQFTAGLTLTAVAAEPGTGAALGADASQTAGAETPGSIDTVFGDVAGDTDANRDGRHSDDDAYLVQTATITVTKTATVISDPFNGGSFPKRIPGAVLEYCIVITNTGSTAADTIVVSDSLAGQPVTFSSGTIFAGGASDCTGGTAEDDNDTGGDETDLNGGNITGSTVTISVPTIAGGGSTSGRFRVTINN